jgi:hypothetical protein
MVASIFIDVLIALKRKIQTHRLNRAVSKANRMSGLTGYRFLVLKYGRGYLVISKQRLRRLIREKHFSKGFTIRTAEKLALHITN